MRKQLSWDIIKRFAAEDRNSFSYQDIMHEYPDTDKVYLAKVLSTMIEKGMLIRLSQGIYHIVPNSADAKNYIPDWHLVSKHIMKGKEYYIGYYSAMQVHGLIIQPSLKEIIVTNLQVKPTSRRIQGVEFQFVTHTTARFFGYKNTWINKHDKVMVSDLEKTIVDALSRPQLSGGMVEVGRVIYETRDKVNLDKLLDYLLQNESLAAVKRYLFICDLVDVGWTTHHQDMLKKTGSSYSLLDTSAPDQGSKNFRFGLKINIDTDTIKKAIYS